MPHFRQAQVYRRCGATVLIVDDNDAVRCCLEEMFSVLGYAAEVAADGVEALPKLQSGDYAAVICDLSMPHMDGDQLYEQCRRMRRDMASRFIFITGEAFSVPAGGRHVASQPRLVKPFRLSDIQAALTEVAAAS